MNSGLLGKEDFIVKEITIEELVEDVEILLWEQGLINYIITENFMNRGKYIYRISGLHIEVEDDIVCCTDIDYFLLNNKCVLKGFLKDRVIIHVVNINNSKYRKLNFDDGCIIIETA